MVHAIVKVKFGSYAIRSYSKVIKLDGSLVSKQSFLSIIRFYYDNNNDHYSALEIDNCFITYHYAQAPILTPSPPTAVKFTPKERLSLSNPSLLQNTSVKFPNTMDLDL
jgi:hypothetical protein